MSIDPVTDTTWLAPDDLELVRGRVPMVYVDAVPVRLDMAGRLTHVGLLLRVRPDGTVSRAVVSGRVLYGETVREALLRHLAKDLGPAAWPSVPPQPSPFTVAEYFPDPGVTGFHDPRQHAVSLAFVVPVSGECAPAGDALDFVWVTPDEAVSEAVREEMTGGQDRLVRLALAFAGCLP
ncbi:MAG: NUDIX hydrolase family protein [Acidimicrobiales bacterium]|nr:NUDIX hydrolase family protein [Acidimicrobiales bacterium]